VILVSEVGGLAERLASWAERFEPSAADVALADLALTDTVCVALAARNEPILAVASELPRGERWSVASHILDFDDLHLPSTTHISAICVPGALATGTGARGYLVGAGVMARLGIALGHAHYTRGWHATATAGAIAAAAVGAVALDLDRAATAQALALAVSAAGGVQMAFGTDAKSLQVGAATGAGLRAANLVSGGASASPRALEQWTELVGGDPAVEVEDTPAVPDGLAIKLYPCCYALQRPIGAAATAIASGPAGAGPELAAAVDGIAVRTPLSTIKPLIHTRPATGLEGKFSLEYGVAAAVLDGYPGFSSFTDAAVRRPAAQRLLRLVEVETTPEGEGLLAGEVAVEISTARGTMRAELAMPPGSPANPATALDLEAKFAACLAGSDRSPAEITWASAASMLDALWS
jgi:2-methylcitrate dehydratase PrpD